MDVLFEIVVELVFEGVMGASTSEKLPKGIRYTAIALVAVFGTAMIGCIFLASALAFRKTILGGSALAALGILVLVMAIRGFRKAYLKEKQPLKDSESAVNQEEN